MDPYSRALLTRDGIASVKSPVTSVNRCQKEISKTVSAKPAAATKAMTKETRQQRRVFRERDHAVADVARRRHLEFLAQASGTATVVETVTMADRLSITCLLGFSDEPFRTGEKSREAGTTSNGYQLLTI
jgi:hypothetical protein